MQFHFHANESHFHKNGFALRLALKQRNKGTSEMAYCIEETDRYNSCASRLFEISTDAEYRE